MEAPRIAAMEHAVSTPSAIKAAAGLRKRVGSEVTIVIPQLNALRRRRDQYLATTSHGLPGNARRLQMSRFGGGFTPVVIEAIVI
jgi:hypothetical protein